MDSTCKTNNKRLVDYAVQMMEEDSKTKTQLENLLKELTENR
jgi:hypothetical protein